MSEPNLDSTTPSEFKKENDRELKIVWRDSHQSLYRFRDLRGACLCAYCVDERTGVRVLDPDSIPEDIHPLAVNPVGHYGVQFEWSDGHKTGIYSFDYLRAVCLCKICQPS